MQHVLHPIADQGTHCARSGCETIPRVYKLVLLTFTAGNEVSLRGRYCLLSFCGTLSSEDTACCAEACSVHRAAQDMVRTYHF